MGVSSTQVGDHWGSARTVQHSQSSLPPTKPCRALQTLVGREKGAGGGNKYLLLLLVLVVVVVVLLLSAASSSSKHTGSTSTRRRTSSTTRTLTLIQLPPSPMIVDPLVVVGYYSIQFQ